MRCGWQLSPIGRTRSRPGHQQKPVSSSHSPAQWLPCHSPSFLPPLHGRGLSVPHALPLYPARQAHTPVAALHTPRPWQSASHRCGLCGGSPRLRVGRSGWSRALTHAGHIDGSSTWAQSLVVDIALGGAGAGGGGREMWAVWLGRGASSRAETAAERSATTLRGAATRDVPPTGRSAGVCS